jgi:hypothetical protein
VVRGCELYAFAFQERVIPKVRREITMEIEMIDADVGIDIELDEYYGMALREALMLWINNNKSLAYEY